MNELAWWTLSHSELELSVLGVALVLAGFFLGLALRRGSRLELQRVPYLLWSGAITCAMNLLPLAWAGIGPAIRFGILWLLTFGVFGVLMAFGALLGAAAHARSVNAYGNGGRGWMGIVPFANLALLFRAPLHPLPVSIPGRIGNVLGVVFGIALIIFGNALGKEIEAELARTAGQTISTQDLIGLRGLERVLTDFAATEQTGALDEVTRLVSVTAEGRRLVYLYELTEAVPSLSNAFLDGLAEGTCSPDAARVFLEAGATIEHRYRHADGAVVAVKAVTWAGCSP